MKYRILGKTGLKVSLLGFGGIPIRSVSEEAASAVVNRALDLGVNFIHTSITYGDSAFKIGQVMKKRRDECYLAVKIGGRTCEDAAIRLSQSLQALQTDHVEIAELPVNATVFQQVMSPGGAYEAFEDAKEAGLIDFIGITSHDVDFLTEAITTDAFSNLITPFNYVATKASDTLFSRARARRLGIICMKTLGRGGLPQVDQALRFVLHHDVDTAIVGMRSIAEVEENLNTTELLRPLTQEEEQQLHALRQQIIQADRLSSSGAVLQTTGWI